MELSGPKIKKFLTFSYISGNVTFLKKLLIFQEMEPSSLKLPGALFKPKLEK